MASSSTGTSSQIQNSMDQRKRKRMQSNRESARRSRIRKQKHLDDLTLQISQISNENNQILKSVNVSTREYVKVEAENSILRAQMTELSQRLQSLTEILNYINSTTGGGGCVVEAEEEFQNQGFGDGFLNAPIMASAHMFDSYYY